MKYLTQKEVADSFNVAPRTIRKWHGQGFPFVRINGRPRYELAQVQRFADRHSEGGGRRDGRIK